MTNLIPCDSIFRQGVSLNIFFVDTDPKICAQSYCDKHVIKMIVETAQLLSSAHHLANSTVKESVYRLTHKNHPCSIWVRQSKENYKWTLALLYELIYEYEKRYQRYKHKTKEKMIYLRIVPDLPEIDFSEPPQALPIHFKRKSSVEAYREYYVNDKMRQKWCAFKDGLPNLWLTWENNKLNHELFRRK